ncbi:mCG140353, partial [Mus musculus]
VDADSAEAWDLQQSQGLSRGAVPKAGSPQVEWLRASSLPQNPWAVKKQSWASSSGAHL